MDEHGEDKEWNFMRETDFDNVEEEQMMVYLALATNMLFSSDEEMDNGEDNKKLKAANKDSDFEGANEEIIKDYFSGPDLFYNERDFERRFWVPRTVFNVVHDKLLGIDPFVHKRDCFGNWSIYPLVKLVACF
jgi:hypothetical protein